MFPKRSEAEEVAITEDNTLQENNIYCKFIKNKNNVIESIKVLIVGPPDSPYHNGFFFFTITLPEKYPFECPKAKFETLDNSVRFHPNLYTEGKVCLSIIGTWSGPGWAATMKAKSVIISIQSILISNAIRNEPGYEKYSENMCASFDELVKYNTIKYGVLKMIKTPPKGFEDFIPIIEKHFIKNYDFYKDYITNKQKETENNESPYQETLKDNFYRKNQNANYKELEQELNNVKSNI